MAGVPSSRDSRTSRGLPQRRERFLQNEAMKLYLCIISLCVSAILAAPGLDPELDSHWNLWKTLHNKSYSQKENSRRIIWEKNLKMIEQHNLDYTLGKHTFKMGMNHFSDMTTEEFWTTMNGYTRHSRTGLKGSRFLDPNYLEAPTSVDWRKQGYVTPVKDQDGQGCHYDPQYNSATCTDIVDIDSGDEQDLMNTVAAVGPVSVAIDAGHASFQFYQSGIYTEPKCSSEELDHAVLVVGYGFEGADEDAKKYWIVKNSWGADWGERGYILMAKDQQNQCGIASEASYPLV